MKRKTLDELRAAANEAARRWSAATKEAESAHEAYVRAHQAVSAAEGKR